MSGKRIIVAGGGTGGHIFPAIAIANALRVQEPDVEILFVGAEGKMEMEKVPQAGYPIKGLTIAGWNRSSLIKNFALPFKLAKSFLQVKRIFSRFRPNAVIGVGGYSSFPVLKYAQWKGLPTFIHEANSFGGKSNIMLSRKATQVFTATDGMEKFFPKEKIIVTGNPVRRTLVNSTQTKAEGCKVFELDPSLTTVLCVGGSLGARSINLAIDKGLNTLLETGLQVIWQTGKLYQDVAMKRAEGLKGVYVNSFITDMESAYAAADVVVSRSGAMALAELCVMRKPAILVPYPFAAEDHQTANAKKLAEKGAAWMVKDDETETVLINSIIELANDKTKMNALSEAMAPLAITNADERVANEILNIIK